MHLPPGFHTVAGGEEAAEGVEVLAMKPTLALALLPRGPPWTWEPTSKRGHQPGVQPCPLRWLRPLRRCWGLGAEGGGGV